MNLPCEFITRIVLPGLRAWIASEAVKKGIKQKDIAKALGITTAAVSQYMKEKRADAKQSKELFTCVSETVEEIIERIGSNNYTELALMKLMCKMCKKLRTSQELCKLRRSSDPNFQLLECNFCEEAF